MAVIAVQDIALDGLVDPTMTAAAALGDTVPNANERVILYVENASAGQRNITVEAQTDCSHGYTHDEVLTLEAGEAGYIGPFDKERFNTSSQELVVSYDDESSVTLAALNITKAP